MRTLNITNDWRTGWLQAAVLFAFLALVTLIAATTGGCAGKVRPQQLAADYDPLADDGARYAIVGFVAAPEAGLADRELAGDFTAQSDAWSPLLYGSLLAGRADLVTWAWPPVRDNVPEGGLAGLQAALANGEPVTTDMLTLLAGDLPEITYAVAARLDRDEIETSDLDQSGTMRDDVHEDRDVALMPNSLQRTKKIRRTATVTLVVYDLKSAQPVWRGTVSRDKSELLSPKSITAQQDVVVKPATEEGGLPEVEMRGTALEAPALEPLLADACRALVANLFAAPK